MDKNNLEIVVKEGNILITPVSHVPPLIEWDNLFKEARKNGYSAEEDAKDFSDWDITNSEGID